MLEAWDRKIFYNLIIRIHFADKKNQKRKKNQRREKREERKDYMLSKYLFELTPYVQ